MALSDEKISELAQHIRNDLQRLSRKLGFTTLEIAKFFGMDRARDTSGTKKMLYEWKSRTESDQNQCETFVRILRHVKSELADRWFQGIFLCLFFCCAIRHCILL